MFKALAGILIAFAIFITLMALCFIIPIWIANYNFILDIKSRKIKKKIHKYAATDSFWNHDEMINIGKDMFMHVQQAWHNGHFKHLSSNLSHKQKIEWQYLWKSMHQLGYRFTFTKVNIEKVYIIGAIDHYDNERDTFKVAVSGTIRRYLQYKKNGRLAPGNSIEYRNFVDILIFRRINDRWLLDEMKVDASLFQVLEKHDKDYNKNIGKV